MSRAGCLRLVAISLLGFALFAIAFPYISGNYSLREFVASWNYWPESRPWIVLFVLFCTLVICLLVWLVLMLFVNSRFFKKNFPDAESLSVLHLAFKRRDAKRLTSLLAKDTLGEKSVVSRLWPPIFHFVCEDDGVEIVLQKTPSSSRAFVFARVPWETFIDVRVVADDRLPAVLGAPGGALRTMESLFSVELVLEVDGNTESFLGGGMVEYGVAAMDGDEFHLERVCQHFEQTRKACLDKSGT